MEVLRKNLGDVVLHRSEQGTVQILFVFGGIEILGDEALGFQANGNIPGLVAFAMHAKVQHAFALLQVAYPKLTQLLTA